MRRLDYFIIGMIVGLSGGVMLVMSLPCFFWECG